MCINVKSYGCYKELIALVAERFHGSIDQNDASTRSYIYRNVEVTMGFCLVACCFGFRSSHLPSKQSE